MRNAKSIWLLSLFFAHLCNVRASSGAEYTICTNPWNPVVTCEEGKEPKGLDIDEFNAIAGEMDWILLATNETVPNDNKTYYRYKCMDLDSILKDLLNETGECDIETSLGVTIDRLNKGYTYSYPLGRSKLHLMITTTFPSSGWGFRTPFTPVVWIAVFGTGLLVVPCFSFLFELVHTRGTLSVEHKTAVTQFRRAVWSSIATLIPLNHREHVWRSFGARLVLLGYGIMVLIMSNIYIAKLTVHTQVRDIKSDVTSPKQLRGQNITTLEIFNDTLDRYNLNLRQVTAKQSTIDDALKSLKNESMVGWIMEEPWVHAVMNHHSCEYKLHSIKLDVHPYDHALIFGRKTSEHVRNKVNRAVVKLTENGGLVEVHNKFLGKGPKSCFLDQAGEGDAKPTDMNEVWGVWVIFFFFTLCGGLASCLRWRCSLGTVSLSEEDQMEMALADLRSMSGVLEQTQADLRERFERLKPEANNIVELSTRSPEIYAGLSDSAKDRH